MSIFTTMLMFEWRYFTRQPSFYISSLIFFMLAFLAISLNQVGMGGGNVLKNGPYLTGFIMSFFGVFSMFLVVNFVANAAMRDHSSEMAEILYCKPINPFAYQLGRFLGSFAVVVCVFACVPVGLIIGSLMPWVTENRFGPLNLAYYLTTFFYISVPTLLVFSCLFYALAIRVRSMMAVYLGVVAVFILYEVSNSLLSSASSREIAALLDPFAMQTFELFTRYWSVFDKNTQSLTFTGILLQNRLLWLGISLLVMVTLGGFSRSLTLLKIKSKKAKASKTSATEPNELITQVEFAGQSIDHKGQHHASWHQFLALTKFEIKQVIFDPAFKILSGFVFLILLALLAEPKGMFGTDFWPLTQAMVELIRGAMGMLSMIIITYYSAEIIWRERASGMGDIIDSTPTFNLNFWLSKLIAMWSVLILLLLLSMTFSIIFQLAKDYTSIDFPQYLISLMYFSALPWMMLSVLAFLFQVISPNKYIGMFLFVLFILSGLVMEPVGLGHNMFNFSSSPEFVYSDMNGYGSLLLSHSWYMLYWGSLSVAMSILGYGLWQRGPTQALKLRFKNLSYQIGRTGQICFAMGLFVFVLSGANIFYNTRVLNQYYTEQQIAEVQANYEKRYAQFAQSPVPSITKLNATVDIYPQQRKVTGSAQLELINRSSQPITRFLVATPGYRTDELSVEIEGGKLGPVDGQLNTHWFEFERQMLPGETRKGNYRVTRQQSGFVDKDEAVEIVENGTFINNTELFPRFGFQQMSLLTDRNKRAQLDLPPPQRAHKLEDSTYYQQTILGLESGNIEFEATVSTSADQIAIAPGYLQKQWEKDGRRYFHYTMDAPIENYYAFLSARYQTQKTQHNGIDIEMYYHAAHSMNVERMQQAVVDSLDYYSENFGAYQHRQARIIEFPGYRNFAQSFPNTIAYSERIGFINDLRNPDEVDSVYYVTAHEMAHQWWGGQLDGANVQGSTMIVETLAQYSALMLTQQKYGKHKLRSILKFELDRYLRERNREEIEELPLMRVENQQYIHYRKGAVVMMSLVDLIGESRMNSALKRFVIKFKGNQNPYPTTLDLLAEINMDTNEQEKAFIRNLFEQITLYDLVAKQVDIVETADSQFEVSLLIDARRMNADGEGLETEVALSEMVDIGLFMQNPDDSIGEQEPLYLKKHLITTGENLIKIIVAERPQFAGVDPYVKLVDRNSDDNMIEF